MSGDGGGSADVGCGTPGIAWVVDGVQVREQYISVTRRRVIKGGVAGGSRLIYGHPTKYCSHSRD